MTDEQARALLAEVRMPGFPPGGPGNASWWAEHLEETAGDDLADLVAWIEARGGGRSTTPPVQSKSLRAGRRIANPPQPGTPFYYVPRDALNA